MKLFGLKWAFTILLILVSWAPRAVAHCDTLDGPVVAAARQALRRGDITPVLKWVKEDDEAEIRAAFVRTLKVRAQGGEARELADLYFFETLVRVHRAGEGAPYTGLKPAGAEVGPAIAEADKALESGRADKLVKVLTDDIASGLRRRFARVLEARNHADDNVEAGREYVEAYVDFIHYAERLHAEEGSGGDPHEKRAGGS